MSYPVVGAAAQASVSMNCWVPPLPIMWHRPAPSGFIIAQKPRLVDALMAPRSAGCQPRPTDEHMRLIDGADAAHCGERAAI